MELMNSEQDMFNKLILELIKCYPIRVFNTNTIKIYDCSYNDIEIIEKVISENIEHSVISSINIINKHEFSNIDNILIVRFM